ncbi:MAG: UpxY family transcription antiterminator, partial [Gramella sp.]|nr:UpxY family transcription antiterminator [Christiangramia sp.]
GWYVLYTKPRMEIKVAKSLMDTNYEVFCPTTKQIRNWSDRKKKVEVPLFNSYVFIRIKNSERSKVFGFPGVVRYLYWLGKPAIARDGEIDTIKNWLKGDTIDDVRIQQISPGDQLKVKSGIFQDKEGIVQKIGSKRIRLILREMGITINVSLRECI